MSDIAHPSQVLAAPVFCGGGSLGALAGTGLVAAALLGLRRWSRRLAVDRQTQTDALRPESAAGTIANV